MVNDAGARRVAGFTFNGWGVKLPPYNDDALLKARLCEHSNTPMYPIDLVLEGGAVTVDGEVSLSIGPNYRRCERPLTTSGKANSRIQPVSMTGAPSGGSKLRPVDETGVSKEAFDRRGGVGDRCDFRPHLARLGRCTRWHIS